MTTSGLAGLASRVFLVGERDFLAPCQQVGRSLRGHLFDSQVALVGLRREASRASHLYVAKKS